MRDWTNHELYFLWHARGGGGGGEGGRGLVPKLHQPSFQVPFQGQVLPWSCMGMKIDPFSR